MFGILQRYTLREIAGPTALGLIVFTFLLLVHQLFRMMDLLVNTSITLVETAELIGCMMPALLSLTIPMAVMLGILLGLGRLASENEILAIRASGVHLFRIYTPIIIVAAALSGLMVWANQNLAPALALKAADLELQIRFKLANAFEPDRVYKEIGKDDQESAFAFDRRDPKTGDLEGVTMKVGNSEKSSMPNSVVFISAPRGRVIPKPDEAAIHVILDDGTLHFQSFAPERADEYDIANFKHLSRETIMNLGRRNEDGTFRRNERQYSVAELQKMIGQAEAARKSLSNLSAREMDKAIMQVNENYRDRYVRRYRVEVAERFSIPLACVAISLLAIPLAIYIRPSAKTLGFAIALGLTFTYYVLVQWGVKVGLSGSDWGVPLIYAPNLLLGGIGLALMIQTVRR